MTRLWKVLSVEGLPVHGGSGAWDLGGAWMPRIADLDPCKRGYHLCRTLQLLAWGRVGAHVWEVEADTDGMIVQGDKVVVHAARLVRRCPVSARQWREFACDCAERALPLFERDYPNDARSRACIAVARRYAVGLATDAERAAARDAAGAAARDAAGDAAWDAAGAAAWDAAWAAAGAAARDAEREWQRVRLEQYLDGRAYGVQS